MRRRDIRSVSIASAANSLGYVQPASINWDGNKFGSGCQQSLARSGISGFFKPHPLIWIQQNLRRELYALLRSGGYQDLRRLASDRANRAQIFGDCFAKGHVSLGVAVSHQLPRLFSQMAIHKLRPDSRRKMLESRKADAKCAEMGGPSFRRQSHQRHAPRD